MRDRLIDRLAGNIDSWRRRVEYMGRVGIGVDAAARLSGVGNNTLYAIVKRRQKRLDLAVMERLADAMELDDPSDLFSATYDWDRHFAVRRFGRGTENETAEIERTRPPRRPRKPHGEEGWRWKPKEDA